MSDQIDISAENLANIGAALDGVTAALSVEEQGLLAAVFQAAAVQIHGDVQGFAATYTAGGGIPKPGAAFGSVFPVTSRVAIGFGPTFEVAGRPIPDEGARRPIPDEGA